MPITCHGIFEFGSMLCRTRSVRGWVAVPEIRTHSSHQTLTPAAHLGWRTPSPSRRKSPCRCRRCHRAPAVGGSAHPPWCPVWSPGQCTVGTKLISTHSVSAVCSFRPAASTPGPARCCAAWLQSSSPSPAGWGRPTLSQCSAVITSSDALKVFTLKDF